MYITTTNRRLKQIASEKVKSRNRDGYGFMSVIKHSSSAE
ncbi:hypothetical protein SAMN04487758_11422 [Enterococcus mundtii]|nr:hypothetical protein SAMN04487758_11422 [Enterococcus mundtii]